jgi:hypothetical protein
MFDLLISQIQIREEALLEEVVARNAEERDQYKKH